VNLHSKSTHVPEAETALMRAGFALYAQGDRLLHFGGQ
jgi:hypothetical protein